MRALAVLSMHTSPLALPGVGDGGGMNVYVRELATALARSGVRCEVFTRADNTGLPDMVDVEPGFRVHNVLAGPKGPVPKEALVELVDEWTEAVAERLVELESQGFGVDVLHAHYWLSGLAGHALKHRLGMPLISTFHTLDRVKAGDGIGAQIDLGGRAEAEAAIIGCSDAVLASCSVEAEQLADLYSAQSDRIEILAPGVDHAYFGPGDRRQARRAIGVDLEGPMVLFVGRIQPLKGLSVAAEALGLLVKSKGESTSVRLVVVGGPSGPEGPAELERVRGIIRSHQIEDRVLFMPPQPHEILSGFYRAADVCIVPSRSESFGLVALEAAACGVPVVASGVGGLTTLVDHGRTGYLVCPDDVEGFASHLRDLLEDRMLAECLGRTALTRSAPYTWSAAAGRLKAVYERLSERQLVSCI